jgi:hypothetical protein
VICAYADATISYVPHGRAHRRCRVCFFFCFFFPYQELSMKKLVPALIVTGLMAATGAYAQSNPPGANVPPNTPGYATGKSERAGEARKDRRAPGMVKPQPGDEGKTPEGGAIGNDRAAVAGERRAETRDERRPGKPKPVPGGTPK